MTWAAVAIAGAAVVGAVVQSRSQREAAETQAESSGSAIEEQRLARESFERRTQPFADIGLSAADPLRQLLGLADPRAAQIQTELAQIEQQLAGFPTQQTGQQVGSPGGGGLIAGTLFGQPQLATTGQGQAAANAADFNSQQQATANIFGFGQQQEQTLASRDDLIARRDALQAESQGLQTADPALGPDAQLAEINPLVSFLRDEGFSEIQETAAARGRLGAGGTLEDLTRFNTNLASTVVPQLQQQRFNQLFNLLGLGSNVTVGQGTAGLQTATNISNILGQQGAVQGQADINQGQIQSNLIGDLAGVFGAQQGGLFNQQQPVQQNQLGLPISSGQDFGGFA